MIPARSSRFGCHIEAAVNSTPLNPTPMPLTEEQIAGEFPLDADTTYLNHAGVAPWPRRAAAAIAQFAEENVRRGARDYPRWMELEGRLRQRLASLVNAPSPADIALVKNTSEALSFVAWGLDWQAGDNVVISNQEFPSNRIVWESLAPLGVEVRQVDLSDRDGPEAALAARVDGRTRVLAISSVQYASGLRMDLPLLGSECRRTGVLFCVDAIQSLGALPFDLAEVQADFVMADGHKWMLGPEGLGLFYCRAELRDRLRLHEYGWHSVEHPGDYERRDWALARDARRFECGSPNMLGACGLEASLALLEEVGMTEVERRVLDNVARLAAMLAQLPGIEVITPLAPGRHAGILTFRHSQLASAELYQRLMAAGIVCAPRGGGVRLSPHFYTGEERLRAAVAAVAAAIRSAD